MKSIADLTSRQAIEQLAIPSNIRYGTAIYEREAVEFIVCTPLHVEAWAGGLDGDVKSGGGSRRRVEFISDGETLKWHCTGNPRDHQVFCKHCVAVALAVASEVSARR